MARKWSNLNLPGALEYVTGNVVNRIPIFKQERCCLEFLKMLKEQLDKWPSKLITYVVMPDHFHLIVNPRDGDKAFPLWSGWMIWQKINYIHNNPVRAKLVRSAKDYRWSGFRAFYLDSQEPLPVDHDWWWPEDGEKLKEAMKAKGWKGHYKKECKR